MIDKFLTFYYSQSNANDIQYIINDLIEKYKEKIKQDFENKKKLIDDSFKQRKIYIENNKDSYILKKIIDENNKQQYLLITEFDFLLKSDNILDENNEIISFKEKAENTNIIAAFKKKNDFYKIVENISFIFEYYIKMGIVFELDFDELFIINNKLFFDFYTKKTENNFNVKEENILFFCLFIINLFDSEFSKKNIESRKSILKNKKIPDDIKDYLNGIIEKCNENPIKILKNISNLLK